MAFSYIVQPGSSGWSGLARVALRDRYLAHASSRLDPRQSPKIRHMVYRCLGQEEGRRARGAYTGGSAA